MKFPRATRLVITISGRKYWLWRAVDQEGYVLDEIMQTWRNTKAARRLLTRLLKKQGLAPKRLITDKLGSYAAARRQIMPSIKHRSHKGLNNRAENSHLPPRRRERAMQGFRSQGVFNGSFRSSRLSATPSSRLAPNVPPFKSTSIASTPKYSGRR
ncbi:DDE superfamily endonuclease [Phyllobacterium brassicacearum]|nr:DDE superfamily endonuclease [Phyllobacterium brassicacearum]